MSKQSGSVREALPAGGLPRGGGPRREPPRQGEAVQVETSVEPCVESAWFHRLKLKYNGLLYIFGFQFQVAPVRHGPAPRRAPLRRKADHHAQAQCPRHPRPRQHLHARQRSRPAGAGRQGLTRAFIPSQLLLRLYQCPHALTASITLTYILF